MKPETIIVKAVRVHASELGCRLFRNNVGAMPTPAGGYIEFGLCPGSSDLIGWRPLIITPDMVGKTIAQFLAVECKTVKGKAAKNQEAFIATVQRMGGIAGVARNNEELDLLLRG